MKLYSRDTASWLMLPWQGRAALPLLLRKCDMTGLLDVGARDPLRALAVLVGLPREVLEPGLQALLDDGVLERVDRGFLFRNYIEAQEATKTPAQKKRDQRERDRAKARETVEQPVTESHRESPAVTGCPPPAQPSPAQPPAQPKEEAPAAAAAPVEPSPPRAKKTPSPRFAPLRDRLVAAYEFLRREKYPFSREKDPPALNRLIEWCPDDATIEARWRKGLALGNAWPGTNTIAELASGAKWAALAAPAAKPKGGISQTQTSWTQDDYDNAAARLFGETQ